MKLFKSFLENLRLLPATGEVGFEGMLRDAVAKIIDRQLRLVKPGPQGGIDMASDASGAVPVIAVEAKRYGERSSLSLDQLKAKLVDAVHQRPELDLFVIGATCEISRDDEDALIDLGDREGIGVVVIDWPSSVTELPTLAVLCALAPESLLERIDHNSDAKSCIEAVRDHTHFSKSSETLINRLTQPDLGWSAARRSITEYMRSAFTSRNAALGKLGSLVNLLDTSIHRISRPHLNKVLDQWWEKPETPLVLLGEEGVGKSWAPLAWWHEKAGSDGNGLPLTIVIPAREVSDTDIEGLFARLLAKRTGVRDPDFWKRRLRLWLKSSAEQPRFLLIYDGLNENWNFLDWNRILVQLSDELWVDKIAVILTCRPDHWTQKLHQLADIIPPPKAQQVTAFDENELDALLALHGLKRGDFVSDLLPLLRVPRLCNLAIRHRTAMAESGDITRERLIYEDWKDRITQKGARLVVGDDEFRDFIAGLGRKLHQNFDKTIEPSVSLSRRELTTELGAESGHGPESLYNSISEIIDGRWMRPKSGKRNQFILNKDLTPYALGMALVETLKDVSEHGLDNCLSEFMEPLGEQDLAVDLLRAAVTVALSDTDCAKPQRRVLIGSWLRRQNFRPIDFEAFWRLMPGDLNLFFSLAEEQWLHRHAGHYEDEILIKGFANAAEHWPVVSERVLKWCTTWLGTHWDDPWQGMVINYEPNRESAINRREETRKRRSEWDAVSHLTRPPIPIRDGTEGSTSWLACRMFGILSYLPREPFVSAITAWAVSRAIMDEAPQYDQVSWLLRLPGSNNAPGLQQSIKQEAHRLLDLINPIATDAARLLLEVLATPDAAEQAESLPHEKSTPRVWNNNVTVDTTNSIINWDHEKARANPHTKESPLSAVRGLGRYAINPGLHLTIKDTDVLRELADSTEVKNLWQSRGHSSDDYALNDAETALARWAPEALGGVYRQLYSDLLHRSEESIKHYGLKVLTDLLLLTETERDVITTSISNCTENYDDKDLYILSLQLAALAEMSAREQIENFLTWPDGPKFDRKHRRILAAPSQEDFLAISKHLNPGLRTNWLCNWLWYLCYVELDNLPKGYTALVPLFNHPEHRVRQLALEVVYKSDDEALGKALVASGWHWTPDMNRDEGVNGSSAMIMAANHFDDDRFRERICPEALGFLATRECANDEDVNIFAQYVQQRIEDDFSGRKSSWSMSGRRFFLENPVDKLVSKRGKDVISWIEPLLSGSKKPHFGMYIDSFPYVDISRAVLKYYPEEGVKLWRIMHEHNAKSGINVDTFFSLPFEVPDSDPVLELRSDLCGNVYTDDKLMKVAFSIIDYDNQKWMMDFIHQNLNGQSSGEIARGIWMAGLLDSTSEAENLWKNTLSQPPASGWLSDVYKHANIHFLNNSWAHHWLEEFLFERNRDKAFGNHYLFIQSADRRASAWAPKYVGSKWNDLPKPWQTHWGICWQELSEKVKTQDKEWKKTLFGTKITDHIQWPWR